MLRHSLVAHCRLDDIVAFRKGEPITVRRFLEDVYRLVARLPAGQSVLNACTDRYRFATGLAAAMVAGNASLLPANLTAGTIARLREWKPDLICLTDGDCPDIKLPQIRFCDTDGPPVSMGDVAIPEFPADQPVAWLFTSGSTGEPVPHLKTWGSLVRNVGIEADRLGLNYGRRQVIVATVPPQHSYGLESSVLVALQSGVAFSAARPFYPVDICAALAEAPPPRVLVSTPFHLRLLVESGTAIPEIDLVVSATAPLSSALVRQIEDRCAAPLLEIYGSTDTGQIASRRPSVAPDWELFTDIRLVPEEDGTWASGGHVGQPIMLHDVVELTGPDRFVLLGRSADLVNIVGKRSSLAFLTHQLTTIPGVLDGTYFMPDEADARGVTRLAALVVAPTLTSVELNRALRARIDPAFLPRPLVFVDSLPRDATGKMPRDALRNMIDARDKAASEHR